MPPVMLIAMARAIRPSFVVGLALSAGLGCAGMQPVKEPPPTTELELAYDSGPASERPLLPQASFEWLIKFEPNLPGDPPDAVCRRRGRSPGRDAAYPRAHVYGGTDLKWPGRQVAA